MKSIYVYPSKDTQVYPSGDTRIEKYTRIPASVLLDTTLSSFDVRVFGVLALATWQGSTCSVGMRHIAKSLGSTTRLVQQSVQRLIVAKHLTVPGEPKRGMRAIYILTSQVFGQKQGRVNVVRSTPKGKRLVSVEKSA